MIWVDQPVNTGFSHGEVRVPNAFEVAQDFLGFFKNWQKLFGIKNFKIYLTVNFTYLKSYRRRTFANISSNAAGRILCGCLHTVHLFGHA